ncbi:MAG: histidine kinase [Mycobacterium sp.]
MDWLRDFAMRRRGLVSYEFPFTVPAVMYIGTLLVAGTAAVQRDFTRPSLLIVANVLVFAPIVALVVGGYKLPTLVTAALVLPGVAILLQCWPPVFLDAAPFLLMFMLGEMFALGSARDGLLGAAASALLLVEASRSGHLTTFVPYLLFFLAIAAMLGHILQLQQRLVLQERDRQAARTQQATADERRRIAREIHDVIAHSLSVTMLHLTGARRALQEDHDVEEAVDGLLDAERLGRQAMSDIRRTVGLLGSGPREDPTAPPPPEPGMADIPDLVSTFATAGLRVDSHIDGAPDTVTAGVGLALYRVAQESLANIAKHAPASNADLQLRVAADAAVLTVRNDLPPGTRTPQESGSGLSGMRQRIEVLDGQFRAGPDLDGWTVQARVPISADVSPCPIIRKHLHRNRISHD